MTGFKLQTSGIGSNHSTNWATTTANLDIKLPKQFMHWLPWNKLLGVWYRGTVNIHLHLPSWHRFESQFSTTSRFAFSALFQIICFDTIFEGVEHRLKNKRWSFLGNDFQSFSKVRAWFWFWFWAWIFNWTNQQPTHLCTFKWANLRKCLKSNFWNTTLKVLQFPEWEVRQRVIKK